MQEGIKNQRRRYKKHHSLITSMGEGIILKAGELIDVLNVLKERYGDEKINILQKKIKSDEEINSLSIYRGLLGGKKIRVILNSDGIIDRFKRVRKLRNIKDDKKIAGKFKN